MPQLIHTSEGLTPTVIIIDDDPTSSMMLEGLLHQEGITTMTAANGPEGRALIKNHKPDLVILDIQMPNENGLTTCALLKNDPLVADIPVIFLTSAEDAKTKIEGFDAGAVDYITKPFYPFEVLARVRVHIRMRRAFAKMIQSQVEQIDKLASAQKTIMPKPEEVPDALFSVYYHCLHEAGGDFYDVIRVGEGIFDCIVADVCDHDLGSSLLTSALKVLIHQGHMTLSSPLETLKMANKTLFAAFGDGKYITLAYARLNRKRKTLTTISAGHPPIFILHPQNRMVTLAPHQGDVLGSFENIIVKENKILVSPGDLVFLYTDGFVEQKGKTREEGIEHLIEVSKTFCHEDFSTLAERIAKSIFNESYERNDDALLLVIKV